MIEEIVGIDPFYLELAENPKKRQRIYRGMVEETMEEDSLKKIRKGSDEDAFGSLQFSKEAKRKFKIRSSRPRERPRKRKK